MYFKGWSKHLKTSLHLEMLRSLSPTSKYPTVNQFGVQVFLGGLSMVVSTGVLDCCQSIKVSERVPTSNPQRPDIVFKCCPHLLVTTTKQQQEKLSTCAHLTSHRSPIRTVSEEREERRTKIFCLNLAVLPKIYLVRAGVYFASFTDQRGRGNSFVRQKEDVGERGR